MSAKAKEEKVHTVPSTLNATLSAVELAEILLTMSTNVTFDSVLQDIRALPAGEMTNKLGSLVPYAATSIRGVLNAVMKATNLNIPEEWKVNNGVNMSKLAMSGHLMFLLDDTALTELGGKCLVSYRKSLGGARNILEFGQTGVVPAKEERTAILREWAQRFKGVNLGEVQDAMAEKWPHLVKARTIANSGPLGWVLSYVLYPFKQFGKIPGFLYSLLKSIVAATWKFTLFAVLIYLLRYEMTRTALFALLKRSIRVVWAVGTLLVKGSNRALKLVPFYEEATSTAALLATAAHEALKEVEGYVEVLEQAGSLATRISEGELLVMVKELASEVFGPPAPSPEILAERARYEREVEENRLMMEKILGDVEDMELSIAAARAEVRPIYPWEEQMEVSPLVEA